MHHVGVNVINQKIEVAINLLLNNIYSPGKLNKRVFFFYQKHLNINKLSLFDSLNYKSCH